MCILECKTTHGISIQQAGSAEVNIVSHSQTFRLTAEGLDYIAAFIDQGPPRYHLTDMQSNQSQFVLFCAMFRSVKM